jgi:hypothetical protein
LKDTSKRKLQDPGALRLDPDFVPAIAAGLKRGGRQGLVAYAWATGLIRDGRARSSAVAVLERYKRDAAALTVTVGVIRVARDLEMRASLARHGGREAAHLRMWCRGADGGWWPTKKGITVRPERLLELEAMVRGMREAYAAGVLRAPAPPPV